MLNFAEITVLDMPKKDKYHDQVRRAIEKDGWVVTHDPLHFKIGKKEIFIDLGAERLIAAEKGNEKIAVEVKSFLHLSFLAAFYEALGKFILYEEALEIEEPDRVLFLAIPEHIYENEMEDEMLIQKIMEHKHIQAIVINVHNETVVKWIK